MSWAVGVMGWLGSVGGGGLVGFDEVEFGVFLESTWLMLDDVIDDRTCNEGCMLNMICMHSTKAGLNRFLIHCGCFKLWLRMCTLLCELSHERFFFFDVLHQRSPNAICIRLACAARLFACAERGFTWSVELELFEDAKTSGAD